MEKFLHVTDFPHISHVEKFLHVTEFPHIYHVEKFSTWQHVMGKISPHDHFFLHRHCLWCLWQIWGMNIVSVNWFFFRKIPNDNGTHDNQKCIDLCYIVWYYQFGYKIADIFGIKKCFVSKAFFQGVKIMVEIKVKMCSWSG